MFVDWHRSPDDDDLDVGQPVAQPRFGDENTVWVVEDPECGGGLVEEPLGDVPDDGPVQFFGED